MTDPERPDPYAQYLAAAIAEDEDWLYRQYYPDPTTQKDTHT